MIEVKTPQEQSGNGVRIELFPSFASDLGRKIYIVEQGIVFRIPYQVAHAHATRDILTVISGDVCLGYRTMRGEIEYMRLEPGKQYVIPPYIPHQIEIRGGILEAFCPAENYEQSITIYEAPTGFFPQGGTYD